MMDPKRYEDFIGKVVKFRLVRMCFIDSDDQVYGHQYCVMAECGGYRCFSEPTQTLDDLKRGITMYEGMVNFLHRNAFSYLDEEDIYELKKARDQNPDLARITTIMVIKNRVDDIVATEKENYPDHEVTPEMVKARMCWEEWEEPEYRRGGR